jgi:large subunit ribosomal protein L7Ae
MPGKVKKDLKSGKKPEPYKGGKKAPAEKIEPATGAAESVLFRPTVRNYGVGNDIQPKRDLTRFVRFPLFVQRQKKIAILERRLKVPPTVNQFRRTLDRQSKNELLKLLTKYRPETHKEKIERLKKIAEDKKKDPKKTVAPRAPLAVKFGIQEITKAVETHRAKLVVIANDVVPLEIVVWLPTLCRKMNVPYCIVKSKSQLGQLVHKKTCTAVAVTDVKPDDRDTFSKMVESINTKFLDKYDEVRKTWGGLQYGKRFMDREAAKKLKN